ncbi:MAG: LptF/LptG family permease [Porphyromonas sp.]|nr:LptF/LptG family permease [Porphyromonas sp.]
MKIQPIKRLHWYMLRTFVPLLLMTFGICWFVVLMQFLWKYVDDMAGKGLSLDVLGQMLFYSAMQLVPMALPLGILLASLMTFGNLGERLELLAMKSAGVPLHRIMLPLFFAVCVCAFGLLMFQNNLIAVAQVKLYTIIYSARNATPELEIPEGVFYNGIQGYNVYVSRKDRESHTLYDMMIYDHSQGFETSRIIRADSGVLAMDESKTFLTLDLYSGRSFQMLRSQTYSPTPQPVPSLDERFSQKRIIIPFDANFKLEDENDMRATYAGKNLSELQVVVDSALMGIDSMHHQLAPKLEADIRRSFLSESSLLSLNRSEEARGISEALWQKAEESPSDVDSLWQSASLYTRSLALNRAREHFSMLRNELSFSTVELQQEQWRYRMHKMEWFRRFAFPAACVVFFFIGAPLGAIIRKGGLGTPIVASVLLFLVYYMLDTFGRKMVNSGEWPVWQGMWLSTAVLLPLGIFLTYKASRDSSTLNVDTYLLFVKRLFNPKRVRKVEYKDVIIVEADTNNAHQEINELRGLINQVRNCRLISCPWPLMWFYGKEQVLLGKLHWQTERVVDYLRDCPKRLVQAKLMDVPLLPKSISRWIPSSRSLSCFMILCLPLSLPLSLYLGVRRKHLIRDFNLLEPVLEELDCLLDADYSE